MRNLRTRYTPAQRKELQDSISGLRKYILPLLLAKQGGVCAVCAEPQAKYDIDHLTYNAMLSIKELQALCIPCHKAKTDFRPLRNRDRALIA